MKIDPKCRAVCFDMDGTLLDTYVDYSKMAEAIYEMLEERGIPPEIVDRSKGYRYCMEKAYEYLAKSGRMDELFSVGKKAAKAMRDIEMEHVADARAFDGIPEMLRKARSLGYRTGVLTRGCREYAEAALTTAGIRNLLDAVVARDDYPESEAKPAPIAMTHLAGLIGVRPDEILFSGDHKFDWQCAVNSSSKFVGVTSGTFALADWSELDPEIIVLPTAAGISDML